jgi:hypothetical protein
MSLSFDSSNMFAPPALRCPGCEGTFTHIDHCHAEVRMEDQPIKDVYIALAGGDVDIRNDGRVHGHSVRRHSITLLLWCESCTKVYEISFAQHKGQTEVDVAYVGERSEIFHDEERHKDF